MIPRYSSKKIEKIWSSENKFSIWLKIECLIAEKLSIDGTIPKKAYLDIKRKSKFNVKEINKIEKKTKHDVIAFIENVSSYIGSSSKFFHYGVTSSDIIDTAFSLQLKQSSEIILNELKQFLKILKKNSIKYKNTIMIGRSHGIHAEPITFGLKLLTFYSEFKRNYDRLKNAKEEISICSISGPVGTYNSINPKIEKYVAKKLNLKTENISTQIIPRDRHAIFFSVLGIIASSVERLAVEIRHLQRTEVQEVEEFFDAGQKGSSAMPHKKNPILSENVTGLARYIRSNVIPSMENIALWHERDISHSSVERIIAPDSTIATTFIISRISKIINKLKIYPKNMKKNMDFLGGANLSQLILLELIKKGLSRKKSYEIIQSIAIKSYKQRNFKDILKKDSRIKRLLSNNEINKLISDNKIDNLDLIFKKVLK
ncbi:MAG: Adenylosuccinate lyase [Alphaproteobacteria bacterium MarineAlpha5_Bin9]|nr:MAG: Adenylosuccinate lyase [Alphaproteobacteria bacterium MarineAlpha5_Bin9]|tara:strand:- start:19967 stop:21253 length:1287 start_codon:yes stop_codon:yes gene_type:complete